MSTFMSSERALSDTIMRRQTSSPPKTIAIAYEATARYSGAPIQPSNPPSPAKTPEPTVATSAR